MAQAAARGAGTLLACVLLAGCGSAHHAAGGGATSGSATTPAAAANGEGSRPARQVVADAAAAIRSVHSYRMHGSLRQNGQLLKLGLTIDSPTRFDVALRLGGDAFEVIVLPSATYLRANTHFLRGQVGPAQAARLSGQWVQVPARVGSRLVKTIGPFAPAILARCLTEGLGTLRLAGTTSIAGTPAVVVRDRGDAPGDSPG